MDHRRPAMRTGARRVTIFQISEQSALFVRRKRLPGLDGHALADARREFLFDLVLQWRFVFLKVFHDGARRGGRITASEVCASRLIV